MQTKRLFSRRTAGYLVDTTDLGRVRYVNLDNAATTPPFLKVERAVRDFLSAYGSVHRGAGTKSQVSTDSYERAREVIKRFVGAPDDSYVLFSGNTTGAMNAAAYFFSFLEGKVAVSDIEHSSSWLPWVRAEGVRALGANRFSLEGMDEVNERIQTEGGRRVLRYGVNGDFEFDLADIERLLKANRIKALVVTASSNATGYCPPLKEIGELAHRYGAYFVVDGCQYIQHHAIAMKELGIDFLAASGHKFYAPYGGGFLIGPKEFMDRFISYQIGGGNLPYITAEGRFLRHRNQLAHDPGTPNAVGAVAMAAALTELGDLGLENVERYERGLAKSAYDALKANPNIVLYVKDKHLNTVLPFNVRGRDAREVAEELNARFGIGVRAGSFCVYNVLRKLLDIRDESAIVAGVEAGRTDAVPAFVRASVSLCNTPEDIERFVGAMNEIAG